VLGGELGIGRPLGRVRPFQVVAFEETEVDLLARRRAPAPEVADGEFEE